MTFSFKTGIAIHFYHPFAYFSLDLQALIHHNLLALFLVIDAMCCVCLLVCFGCTFFTLASSFGIHAFL